MRTASSFRVMAMVLAASAVAYAQGATVVEKAGHGEAAIVKGDEARAFEEAKSQALRAAVEQAAGVRIDADTVTVNNQLVRDQIFANTSGYVKSFDVTAKKAEKGVYSVDVKAQVITENLDKDIQAAQSLVKRMGKPSIVISIQEQTQSLGEKGVFTSDTMAKFLGEALAKDGWDVKDPAALDKDFKLGAAIASGDAQTVRNIGALTKAAFVIYGTAAFRHQAPDSMMKGSEVFPVSGEYGLNVFSSDNGSQIGRMADTLVISDAKKQALISYERTAFNVLLAQKDKFVGQLRAALLEYLRNQSVNGTQISLTVKGLENFGAVNQFQKAVETVKGVKSAEFLNDFQKGTASYRVSFQGKSADFAEALESASFKKKKIDVVGQTANTMEVAIGK